MGNMQESSASSRAGGPDSTGAGQWAGDMAGAYAAELARTVRRGPRSYICRLPDEVRRKVDEAILALKPPLDSYPRILAHFRLKAEYGITLDVLRTYARRLWWLWGMTLQRTMALELLGQGQAADPQGFARKSGIAVANCLLDFFLDPELSKKDPEKVKLAVANFALAYKSWIHAESVMGQGGESAAADRPAGDICRPLPRELRNKIRTEIYGLPPLDSDIDATNNPQRT